MSAPYRRIIPILERSGISFRWLLFQPNSRPGSDRNGAQWASCQTEEGTHRPQFVTRTLGTGRTTLNIGFNTRITESALRGQRTVTSLSIRFAQTASPGTGAFQPQYTRFTSPCIDDQLRLRN